MNEDKPVLTDEEIEKYSTKYSHEVDYLNSETLQKMKNTIEKIDEDLKSMKGLKRFIHEGVLVSPNLIISAKPDDFRLGLNLKAFDDDSFRETGAFVNCPLTVEQTKRLIRMLPELLKASKFHRSLYRLKDLYKNKSKSTSRRRY